MGWIENGEDFNQRKVECAGILNLVKVAEEVLRGRNSEWSLSYEILVIMPKYALCLSKLVVWWLAIEDTTLLQMCLFSANYEPVNFYSKGPLVCKNGAMVICIMTLDKYSALRRSLECRNTNIISVVLWTFNLSLKGH